MIGWITRLRNSSFEPFAGDVLWPKVINSFLSEKGGAIFVYKSDSIWFW
jgi:hypothetical protein